MVLSFALMNSGATCDGKFFSFNVNPWFWLVMKQPAGLRVYARLVLAPVPVLHLICVYSRCEPENLVPETYPKHRHTLVHKVFTVLTVLCISIFGSPGPFDMTTPSGSRSIILSKE